MTLTYYASEFAPTFSRATAVSPGDAAATGSIVAANLPVLRRQRGLSPVVLARLAGVPASKIAALEAGLEAPDLAVLWRLATALDVPFSTLINNDGGRDAAGREDDDGGGTVVRRGSTPHVVSKSGGFASRALFPPTGERSVEFYEIRIAPGFVERSEAHAAGAMEYIVVASGTAEIEAGGPWRRLEAGDAVAFSADQPHAYRNPGNAEAVLHLVLQYV